MGKNILFLIFAMLTANYVYADDLFNEGKLRSISSGTVILKNDTIGGYPIFQDDGRWTFVSGKESESSGSSNPIKMGTILLDFKEGSYLLARQSITATVQGGGSNSFWTGSPCSPEHLIIRNKGSGNRDFCMTIDPTIVNVGAKPVLFFLIALTNTGGNGRYYKLSLYINADVLGIRDTGLGDWTKEELKAKPFKQEALNRLNAWAEFIQDGSIKALDFSKPQNVYDSIPSLMSLLPVPGDLSAKKHAFAFLSAVAHVKNQKDYSSIAYSQFEDYRTGWHFVSGRPTQEVADSAALSQCDATRKINRPSAPDCVVYKINKITPPASMGLNGNVESINSNKNTVAAKLEKLKELFSLGLISKEQYDAQVKDELGKL